MNQVALLDVWRGALLTLVYAGGPFLAAALGMGLFMSVLQAATQLQENILSFAPKLIAIFAVLALSGGSVLGFLVRYFEDSLKVVELIGQGAGG
jgi:flagellar biosynthetic protein FliQ